MTSSHSKVGASSCERWWNCPGSVFFNAQYPPSESSVYAAEGTVAHSICEEIIIKNAGSCKALLGYKFKRNGETHRINEAMIKAAYDCFYKSKIGKVVKESGFDIEITAEMLDACYIFAEKVLGDAMDCLVDVQDIRVEQSYKLDIDNRCWGTCDASFNTDKNLFVYDFKYGKGIREEAIGNKQLMYYALGPLQDFPKLKNASLNIIQPRIESDKGPVRNWNTATAKLREFEKDLKEKVQLACSLDATDFTDHLKAGEHCRWCSAKIDCPAAKGTALTEFKKEFAVEPQVAVNEMAPAKMAEILGQVETIKIWLNAFEKFALGKADAGLEIPGYKLVEKQGHRKWNGESTAASYLEMVYGDDIYAEKKLLSPAQIDKKYGAKATKGLTSKPTTGKKLVPWTSPEEFVKASKQSAETDFANVMIDDQSVIDVKAETPAPIVYDF